MVRPYAGQRVRSYGKAYYARDSFTTASMGLFARRAPNAGGLPAIGQARARATGERA
jgi:hypothetical protein